MNFKNKILPLLLLVVLIFSLTGCTKCINTEYENVEVTVIDEYYRAKYIQPIYNGKSIIMVNHPAVYNITVEYNGIEYTIDDSDTYNKYKDKVKQTAIGTLEIRTYDNGTIKYDIVSLE